jgi:hypothetical protein
MPVDGMLELEEPEELDELGVLVLLAALAERVAPTIAPPAKPAVTRAADAQSLGFVRICSPMDMVDPIPFCATGAHRDLTQESLVGPP